MKSNHPDFEVHASQCTKHFLNQDWSKQTMSDSEEKLLAEIELDVSIWMPIYIDNFIASTIRLTPQQIGAYALLICDYWKNNSLPDDNEALSRITRMPLKQWIKEREIISTFFTVEGKLWKSKKLDTEKEIARDKRRKAKERSAKANKAKEDLKVLRAQGELEENHKDAPLS